MRGAFLSTWLFHGGQCPLSKIGVCACKIICRAALSALMRCHLPSLIAPPPMLITYNCPRAGWLLVFPDGDVLVKRFHMILVTFPSNMKWVFLSHHVTRIYVEYTKNKSNAFDDFQFCNVNLKFDFHIWLMSFASIPGHWPSKLLLHSMSRLTTRNLILIFWGTLNLAFWHFCTLCKTLKGRVFTKTGERHFSKWHFGDHSSSWTHAPNPKNVKSDNTAEIYIGRASYLSCKLGGFDFLVGLIRDRCSRNVQDKKCTSV